MSTLKQAMLLDGQALSNNDPNMAITLKGADAAKVEITSIGNDSITYSFKEGVPTDTLYDLSLSFVYKELYSLDIPLSLVNLGTVKDWTIEAAPISTECWARGEALPFKVIKNEVDITDQLVDVAFVPAGIVKAGDTGAKSWTIESETAFEAQTVPISYTYRLPTDLPEVSRQFTGDFVIAAYDGQELVVTPLEEIIRIPVGTPSPAKFSIKYRNYRDATPYVRYVQAEAVTAPITYASQDLKAAEQEIWVNYTAPSSVEVIGKLVFRANNASSVLGKDKVNLNLNMKGYEPGLILNARQPSVLTGKQNQEVEQTITISMDGESLSMEDVDIVIANPARLSIVSKVGNVVTFKILDANDTAADINNFTNINYSYGGKTVTQMQSIIIKPKKSLTAVPSTIERSMMKDAMAFVDLELNDGDGTVIPLNDPRVSSVFSGTGYVSIQESLPNGLIIKNLASSTQTTIIKFTVAGIPGEALVAFKINYVSGTAVTSVNYAQTGPVQPNQESATVTNTYKLNGNDVTVAEVLLSKPKNNPITGNAFIDMALPTTTDFTTFTRTVKSGWTGALVEMDEYVKIGGGQVYKATGNQTVSQAPITANVLNNTFNYANGAKTDVLVTWVQQRLGQEDHTFATSNDIRNISFAGTVKAATVVNNNGTFTLSVTGNGTKGPGSVTYSVVENGVHYAKKIDLVAIENLNVVIQEQYKTVYGMSNSDIMVRAVAQLDGVNLGNNVIDVVSDNPTITVKSVTTQGGYCDVILTSPAGTELENQSVKLIYTIKEGNPSAGLSASADTKVYITSLKLVAYDLPKYFEGVRFAIGPGLTSKDGRVTKTVILKDGVKMDPQDNDLNIGTQAGKDPWSSEIVGTDKDGTMFVKIRNDTTGIKENFIIIMLSSDPTYKFGGTGVASAKLELNGLTGAALNSNLNFSSETEKAGSSEHAIGNRFKDGYDVDLVGKVIWSRRTSNPETGNAYYNAKEAIITQAASGPGFSLNLKTGWTGNRANTTMLHLGNDGRYRNGTFGIPVGKTPIVVTNNDNTLLGPNLVTPVTLQIHQNRWGDPTENLANTQLLNPTVANNLFTVADLVNNNDGTISFNATATAAGTALFSFTIKDGEFEYPASIQLTVGMYPLELGDGFIKDIEGNSKQTVTVVQNVKLPE